MFHRGHHRGLKAWRTADGTMGTCYKFKIHEEKSETRYGLLLEEQIVLDRSENYTDKQVFISILR
jgi:hypothetical protein